MGTGEITPTGTVSIALVVTGAKVPNVYLNASRWKIGNRIYHNSNLIFRISLPKGEYPVEAVVTGADGQSRQASGRVKVNTSQIGEFILVP